jgi:hypothetical protein
MAVEGRYAIGSEGTPKVEGIIFVKKDESGEYSGILSARGQNAKFKTINVNEDSFTAAAKAGIMSAEVEATVDGDTISGKIKIGPINNTFKGTRMA